jgi:APA family basic amino acid/polyamine antiporter
MPVSSASESTPGENPPRLERKLGFFSVYALIITSMVGTSLFFGVSTGSRLAGSASIISWALLGIVTVYVAAVFGELIAMYPSSGGIYEFTKQAYGRFPSFLIGWTGWIVSNVGSALLVVAAIEFLFPGSGSVHVLGFFIEKGVIKLALAILVILVFNAITYRGIEASGTVLVVCAALVITLILAVLLTGFGAVQATNLAIPSLSGVAILVTVFFLVESFFGWESASFLSEETRNPERTIPSALVWASATVAVLGVLLALVMLGSYPSSVLGEDANPLLTLARDRFPSTAPVLVIGVFVTFLSGVVSSVVSSPRLLFALARDRLFIEQCTRLDPTYKTPVNAILFQSVITITLMAFAVGNYEFLLAILVPLALLMYATVLTTVPVLRRTKPHHPRPFRVWGGSWLPLIVALFYFSVIVGWFFTTPGADSAVLLIIGLLLLAVPIYWFVTVIYNPDVIISVNDEAARVNYWLEGILLPRSVRRELLALFKNHLKGKTVLEYGAGVGTFTMDLADAVGSRGRVIATDISRANIAIIAERVKRRGLSKITILHDEHQINRIHPAVDSVDVVYSIGFLGYVQDVPKVLRELRSVLPENGRICFVEYTNFFKILPDPAIVSDLVVLRETFRKAGFAVVVKRRPGLFWNYIIVEGIRTDRAVTYA